MLASLAIKILGQKKDFFENFISFCGNVLIISISKQIFLGWPKMSLSLFINPFNVKICFFWFLFEKSEFFKD